MYALIIPSIAQIELEAARLAPCVLNGLRL